MVASPKKHLFPLLLLLLLSVGVLLIYSQNHPSLPNSSISTQTFSQNPKNVAPPPFTLTIKVLTFNRLHSVSRCLRSLAAAQYLPGHPVHLHVFIDHFVPANDSQTDQKLQLSHEILRFVDRFEWKWGQKMVHYRTSNVGLQAQWLEAWWPSSDDEFAFVVEDDLEVSPLFYKFLRALILNYYYNASNYSPSIYGASLQRPRFVPGKHGNKIQLDSNTRLFLYQLVGTWGQLLFPKPWKEFRLWYDNHKAKGIKPFLEGMVTTGWYKKMGERIWTPWFIKFIHSRGYFNIYTNIMHEKALSVSHRDAGVNYGKTAGPDSQLLDESSFDSRFLEVLPLSTMKWYDFCFREVLPGRVIRNEGDLASVLHSVQREETVLLLSLFGTSEMVTRNMLCHLERLNIWNYIIMGPHSDFLVDLARRGHAVIDADQFVTNIRAEKLMQIQESNSRLMEDILVKAYIIKKNLEYSYSTWVISPNMVFVNTNLFGKSMDSSYSFYAGDPSLELFFVKSSPSAHKVWTDDFLYNIGSMLHKAPLPKERSNFAYAVTMLLERKGFKVKRVDQKSFGVKIGNQDLNQSSLGLSKVVYWSAELAMDLIQKQLQQLSLWVIDVDSSCTAVACHKS